MPIDPVTTTLLRREFDLPMAVMTETELLDWLTVRVGEMMRYRPEYLMSLCYTLDLDEESVARALDPVETPSEPPFRVLARILYDRQRARASSKQHVAVPPLDDPNAW
ncbi:hypothetical protein CLV84_2451 [Neolewinella xylanilytica]|uniref:Uncharacterized protein n=1 Tax=Neolewinella xylanilytica TaxID=1514080 RepID=A0A2S6I320_9BACT|nr:hypothetical protein [Neolewinella xylanilytica]PPK85550.1 hypothetical protein CLV84_2451 [Neolewinella xylanilytica]